MKIVVAIRSNAAYDLVKTQLALSKKLSDVKVADNVTSLEMLSDFVNYYEADLYLIDKAILEKDEMIRLIEESNKMYLLLEDLKEVDIKVHQLFFTEEVIEETISIPVSEKIEKEIVVQHIEKEILVEKYRAIPPVKILIGGLYSGSGSTLIASNLARMIAARGIDVTYIESPFNEPIMYDTLQIAQNEEPYENIILKIAKDEIPKSKLYFKDKVYWIVKDPQDNEINKFSFEKLNLLLNYAKTTVTIIDVSSYINHSEIMKLMTLTDGNYITLEANPVKNDYHILIKEELALLEKGDIPYNLVLTKVGIPKLDIKGIRENLPKKPFLEIPYISYEKIMQCLYSLKFYYDDTEGNSFLENHFRKLLAYHLPKNFVELKKRKGIFKFRK